MTHEDEIKRILISAYGQRTDEFMSQIAERIKDVFAQELEESWQYQQLQK